MSVIVNYNHFYGNPDTVPLMSQFDMTWIHLKSF